MSVIPKTAFTALVNRHVRGVYIHDSVVRVFVLARKCPTGHNGMAILAKSSIDHSSGSKRARTGKLWPLVDLVGGYCTLAPLLGSASPFGR